jgi:acid phosphatase
VEELEPRLVLASLPYPDHILIAIEENHGYTQIINSTNAPFINYLANSGALFTQSHALEHPSQPNYLDLYSGSNQGQTSDSCPHTFSTANLGAELEQAGYSFGGYSESMPSVGFTGCSSGAYARKHNPWVNFTDVPATDNLPYEGYYPSDDYTQLPTVSFVIPNQDNDMHNGTDPTTIQRGDAWLADNLDAYVKWTFDNNSLFILTFDEDNGAQQNHIATLFVGPMVVPGQYDEPVNHYTILRTIEDIYGLPYAGQSDTVDPISDVWVDGGGSPGIPRGGKSANLHDHISETLLRAESPEIQAAFTQQSTSRTEDPNLTTVFFDAIPRETGQFTPEAFASSSAQLRGNSLRALIPDISDLLSAVELTRSDIRV